MSAYLGQLHAALHEFNEFISPSTDVEKELKNDSTFFMNSG